MTKLKHLWNALEDIPDLLAIPAGWRDACGNDFGLIEASLQPTSKLSGNYPCPYPNGHGCPRRIVQFDDDEIAAICQDPHKICSDLSLKAKDVCKRPVRTAFSRQSKPVILEEWEVREARKF
jgi:hypothetical protein